MRDRVGTTEPELEETMRRWTRSWIVATTAMTLLAGCASNGTDTPTTETQTTEAAPATDDGGTTDDPTADGTTTDDGQAAAAGKTATVELGGDTYEFTDVSCVIFPDEGFVDLSPVDSLGADARVEAVAEEGGRTAVTVRHPDNQTWQYSMGEGGNPEPAVTIDGRTAVFEGTFVDAYGSGEELPGRLELHC